MKVKGVLFDQLKVSKKEAQSQKSCTIIFKKAVPRDQKLTEISLKTQETTFLYRKPKKKQIVRKFFHIDKSHGAEKN